MNRKFVACFLVWMLVLVGFPLPQAAAGAATCTHYVSTTGNDSMAGTSPAAAWKTLQKAANTVTGGAVVCVRGGVYSQRVTISKAGPITFQAYPDETPVLDGTGLTVPASENGMIYIKGASYLVVQGFEIRNYRTSTQGVLPVGIMVSGLAHHVEIRNNRIHHIEHNGTLPDGTDAHGIAVYGRSGTQSIHDVIIDHNELYSLKLGSSEALVLNGNVEKWQVTYNTLHDLDNIGIDAIGFEGTASANDQARNGVISRNHVYNVDTFGNPAYGNSRSAACVYVDGGRQVTIQLNKLHHCNLGVEIASEHAGKTTSYVTVRNNFIYSNSEVGIAMGGYDEQRGATRNCVVVNNTLYKNNTSDDWGAELFVQYDVSNNVIKNNLIYAGAPQHYLSSWSDLVSGNQVDYNLFFSAGGSGGIWEWKGVTYTSFSSYRAASGNDVHSKNGLNPLLASNLHLQSGSPAINTGINLAQSGPVDIDGQARVQNTAVDIGADEMP